MAAPHMHQQRRLIKRAKPNRSLAGDLLNMIMLALMGAFFALPFIFAVSQAFKPLDELFLFPPQFFVRNPTMDNFRDLFVLMNASWIPFSRYLFNTVFITLVGTIGHLLIASLCAYVLAKNKFPGDKFIFSLIIMALMFPGQVTGIPNYLIMSYLRWIDTYLAIVVPAFAGTLGLFLMKQFMEQIPDSLIEAARIDGAGELRVYWNIAMPAVKPAWMTLIIFSFQGLWNTTGGIFIFSEELKTMPFALGQILAGGIARAGVGAAVSVFMMVVPIVVFMVTQSNVIETMTASGIKE